MEIKEFNIEGIDSVEVTNLSVDIVIKESGDSKIQIQVDNQDQCQVEVVKSGNKVIAQTKSCPKKKGFFSSKTGSVEYVVLVPKTIAVEAETGFGDIMLNNIEKAKIETGKGDIKGTGNFLSLTASTGFGDVAIKGGLLMGNLNTGLGDVAVRLSTPPEKGAISLNTGNGDALLELPKESLIQLKASTGLGSSSTSISSSPKASYQAELNMGFGDIKVTTF